MLGLPGLVVFFYQIIRGAHLVFCLLLLLSLLCLFVVVVVVVCVCVCGGGEKLTEVLYFHLPIKV